MSVRTVGECPLLKSQFVIIIHKYPSYKFVKQSLQEPGISIHQIVRICQSVFVQTMHSYLNIEGSRTRMVYLKHVI